MSDSYVATRSKMLTYYRVCSAFESACALPSNMIWGSEAASNSVSQVLPTKRIHLAVSLLYPKPQ